MKNGPLSIVIAGGGTGGHLFPAIAIAEAFRRRDACSRILFMGTGRPLEVTQLRRAGFDHRVISASGVKGQGVGYKLMAVLRVALGTGQSLNHLRRFRPDMVIGVGGYSAGPVVAAAWILRKKIALHEQNVLPGLTNRLLSRLAGRIYVSFEQSVGYFPADRVRVTGNPLRQAFYRDVARSEAPAAPSRGSVATEAFFTVLITGGSQGASSINKLMTGVLDALKQPQRMRFVHQTGPRDEQAVAAAYRSRELTATVKAFFDDMPRRYAQADLVICRAGATTVAELAAAGRPAIYIPYPFAADNHQLLNARAMVDAGAGVLLEEHSTDARGLARHVDDLAGHRQRLARMAARAGRQARRDAAERIVEDCCRLAAAAPQSAAVNSCGKNSHVS